MCEAALLIARGCVQGDVIKRSCSSDLLTKALLYPAFEAHRKRLLNLP